MPIHHARECDALEDDSRPENEKAGFYRKLRRDRNGQRRLAQPGRSSAPFCNNRRMVAV